MEKNLETFNKVFRKGFIEVIVRNVEEGKAETIRKTYICITCQKHLINGKIPPMSYVNNLDLVPLTNSDLHLTEL